VVLLFLGLALAIAGLGLSGRPVRLPVWAVAEAEARLNRLVAEAAGTGASAAPAALAIGGAVLVVDRADWTPRLVVEDLRVLRPGGGVLVQVPEVRLSFDPGDIATGRLRLQSLRLVGARLDLRRLSDGRLDLAFGALAGWQIDSLPALVAAAEAALARPALSRLVSIEAEALSLTLDDLRAGRVWRMGDGRLTLQVRPEDFAAEAALSLQGGGALPALARVTAVAARSGAEARVEVAVQGVAAGDIAAQAPALGWLGLVEGPVSGRFTTRLAGGVLGALEAQLEMGPGSLRVGGAGAAQGFQRLAVAFRHDASRERVRFDEIAVEGASLSLQATGHADLPGLAAGSLPDRALVQIAVSRLTLNPEGMFAAPAAFEGGAIDLRLTRAPFAAEIGQAVLVDGDRRLRARGRIAAEPKGWRVALDFALDRIDRDRLIALWPLTLVPRTRNWVAANLFEGDFTDVHAGLRIAPGAAPQLALGYDFAGTELRAMPTLPPVQGARGHAVIEGDRYAVVLAAGGVAAPVGGSVDVAGSVLIVPDITAQPATGEVRLQARGPMTAMLSLLDQPPILAMQKAGQPVGLGEGQGRATARITFPIQGKPPPGSVDWQAEGVVERFVSDVLVPGRRLEVPELAARGDVKGLTLAGQGTLDGVPFDATFRQDFGAEAGPALIEGRIEVSAEAARRLRLGLPEGLVGGRGEGALQVRLPRGGAPVLNLDSDLAGVLLALSDLGWAKPARATGRLQVTATLGDRPAIDRLALDAAGLKASGRVALRPDGGLSKASFDRVRLGGWLDAPVTLTARGARAIPDVAVTGGTLDLRRLTGAGGAGSGRRGVGAIDVAFDRVIATDDIALTGFRSRLSTEGGLAGPFTARVNGGAAVSGEVTPAATGTAVRIASDDAGGVLSAAGIFPNARGGRLDLTLTPRREGGYAGEARIERFRVRNTPIMAELLNAISVVGLFEQLDGQGLLFLQADGQFTVTEAGIELRRGAAVGASLGVSMAGVWRAGDGSLDMRGTISPVYLLNAVGRVVAKPGEGLFGFNYRLTGTADAPKVAVNPLSILTPGMFREIFRAPPPRLDGAAPEPSQAGPPAGAAEDFRGDK
jgi:hypothetical protein